MKHHYSQLNDENLARIAANDDRAAFDEIVRRYCRPLAEFAASRTVTFQDAEDITQDTFLRAYLNLDSYNAKYSLKNWLFTIAYRLIVSGYRKKNPVRLSEQAAEYIEAKTPAPQFENEELWQAVQNLAADDRTVLWLRYKQDMTTEEIANVIKKSKISVRVRLHRARNRLAELINRQPDKPNQWQLRDVVCMKGTD
jgi:RNA polymerase sigma-70 factor (ECF subfamily)